MNNISTGNLHFVSEETWQQLHFVAADTGVSLDHCMLAVAREDTIVSICLAVRQWQE